ncbi:MAG: YraN family protein [Acidimicrobiales bacterium]
MPSERQRLGAKGEDMAVRWYLDRGYVLVARNWRCRRGELDVVVRRGSLLVVCEVKTRSSSAYGAPLESVTALQQRRVRAATVLLLRELRSGDGDEHFSRHAWAPVVVRFDVASVLEGEIEVLEQAF